MQSAASLARRPRPIAERSIRVLVSPAPITFAERRSVLQVLEQYGPVEVFQMAPDQHAHFISVTKEATTAVNLVSCSPLVYRMPAPPKKTDIHIADLVEGDSSKALNTESTRPSVMDSSSQEASAKNNGHAAALHEKFPSAPEQQATQFKLDIFPAPEYLHQFAMNRSPLHQSWPTNYARDKSFATSILKQSLPRTMASEGLKHWLLEPGCSSTSPAKTNDSRFDRLQLKDWLPSRIAKRNAE
ncbi:hypothetical protein E4U43_005792 [Claviceps pusilla]|uniref:Uncharacterized protein n=1 Tax=Claviceps pusilla TaxID=123648 RepID=A0A9P7SVY6_9HYPO|nr:hypothetical protein E4U43_005792 [Claviceps pusilla]